MESDGTGRDTTSASCSMARALMEVDFTAQKGLSTTDRASPSPQNWPMIFLRQFRCFQDAWSLPKIDLILQNTDKSAWRRFLYAEAMHCAGQNPHRMIWHDSLRTVIALGLSAGMATVGTSLGYIQCGGGCWCPCLGSHAAYQRVLRGSTMRLL